MIELHGARTGNCLRVSVALEEAEIAYRVHRVDLRRGEHLGAAHLALNPEGKVPTIVDDSQPGAPFILSQSNAILFYLAERAPGALLPLEARPRALALERFFFVLTDVIDPNHAAFRLRIAGEGRGAGGLLEMAASMMTRAENALRVTPFVAGNRFGLADIAMVTTLPSILSEAALEELPRLSTWYRQAVARPSVVRGMRAFDPRQEAQGH